MARRAKTAKVCRDWAAVHKDSSSGVWGGANLKKACKAKTPEQRQRAATSLMAWLTARAPALRQLQLCDFESIYVEEDTPDAKV